MSALVRPTLIRTNFFVVMAQGVDGEISDPSNEVYSTNRHVTLNWLPPAYGIVTNYILFRSIKSGSYSSSGMNVGTNLTTDWPLPGLTNLLITVTGSGLEYSPSIFGPWTDTGANSLYLTNPPNAMMFFRGTNAAISTTWF